MNRHAFFEQMAGDRCPLAFQPEHESRIERLHRRLGDLQGRRVYEPGCGAGPLTERLADWVGAAGHVLALDACPGMVARCVEIAGGHRHVRVMQARAEDVELEPGVWDLVLCFRLYPHLDDPAAFLRHSRIGLAPGGVLVIANLEGSASLNALHAQLPGVHGDVMPGGTELSRQLAGQGWRVDEVIDEPDEYFVRARTG